MIQVVLILISISILFIVKITYRIEKKSKTIKNFDDILDKNYKKQELFFEEKTTFFIDKISNLIVLDKIEDTKIIKDAISMIKNGDTEEKICDILNIDKGEL